MFLLSSLKEKSDKLQLEHAVCLVKKMLKSLKFSNNSNYLPLRKEKELSLSMPDISANYVTYEQSVLMRD